MKKISLAINIDVLYDELTEMVTIDKINSIASMPLKTNRVLIMQRRIMPTELKYGIITLGKTEMGNAVPKDADVRVCFGDDSCIGHSHKKTTGRIDRLGSMMKMFDKDDILDLRYDVDKNELTVTGITSYSPENEEDDFDFSESEIESSDDYDISYYIEG